MQKTLYPLKAKDIEAIGRARVNREIPQNMKLLSWAGLVLCLAGVFLSYAVNAMWGIVVLIIGVAGLWYYSSVMDKNRKRVVNSLKREYAEGKDAEASK